MARPRGVALRTKGGTVVARRYPLESLVGVRREKTEKRAEELAVASAASERERSQAEAARERRERAARDAASERGREQARLEEGGQLARDLHQHERFRAATAQNLRELGVLEGEAARRAGDAALAEAQARAALGAARAEEKAIERHRERFQADAARAEEEREAEAAEERWAAAKHGARSD